jgi:hypothetical protein
MWRITLNVELLGEPVMVLKIETICVDFTTGNLISGLTLDSGIPQVRDMIIINGH